MNFKNRALNEQLSDICTQCGMCCDGTLFTHVGERFDEVGIPHFKMMKKMV